MYTEHGRSNIQIGFYGFDLEIWWVFVQSISENRWHIDIVALHNDNCLHIESYKSDKFNCVIWTIIVKYG